MCCDKGTAGWIFLKDQSSKIKGLIDILNLFHPFCSVGQFSVGPLEWIAPKPHPVCKGCDIIHCPPFEKGKVSWGYVIIFVVPKHKSLKTSWQPHSFLCIHSSGLVLRNIHHPYPIRAVVGV